MHLVLNSQLFAQELRLLNKVVATKPTIPILSHVLLDATDAFSSLRMSATDLEIGLRTMCAGSIQEPGTVALPAKTLLDIVEQLPNADVTLTAEKGVVRLTSGAFKSRLQAMPTEEFPSLPEPEGTPSLVSSLALHELIAKTRYAIADTTQKHVVSGVLFVLKEATAAMIATDGKRLAIATAARVAGSDMSVIIPEMTIDVLLSTSGDVSCSETERHLFFGYGDRVLFSRRLEAKFPNYARIIPTNHDKTLTIDLMLLTSAVKRVSLASERTQSLYLSLSDNSHAALASQSAEVGEADEIVEASYVGDAVRVCLNWRHLLDFLQAAQGSLVTMTLKDAKSAVLLSDGESFSNVIMVMQS